MSNIDDLKRIAAGLRFENHDGDAEHVEDAATEIERLRATLALVHSAFDDFIEGEGTYEDRQEAFSAAIAAALDDADDTGEGSHEDGSHE